MICEGPRTIAVRAERYVVSCGSRYCPACGVRWAKDQRIRAVAAAKALPGDCALLTITGPGNDHFAAHKTITQPVVRAVKRTWNGSARERWSDLHREASREPRRTAREAGSDWRVLYRTWEWQRRGVLHLHVVVPFGTDAEVAATLEYVARLHELARIYGFGYVLGGDKADSPTWDHPPRVQRMDVNAVAAYVSKYVSKAGDARNGMIAVARSAGMRGSVLYVSHKLTAQSRVTMATLRNRRRIVGRYPWANASKRGWQEGVLVDSVQRGRPPLAPDAVDAIRALAARGVPGYLYDRATGVQIELTEAPEPQGLGGWEAWPVNQRAVWGVGLASVLRHVPDGASNGWFRTDVAGITVSAL